MMNTHLFKKQVIFIKVRMQQIKLNTHIKIKKIKKYLYRN